MHKQPLSVICLALLLFAPQLASVARTQADPFYKGKTIRIMVGSTAGGFYDRWARLFARYMPKYIPGQPEIIAQNMPGAGSVIAVNHVFNVAKPDGLTAVMPLNSVYVDQLVGRKEVQFDLRKFHWIGSPAVESTIMYMRADTPFQIHRRYHQSEGAAQVWRHGDGKRRLYSVSGVGRDRRGQVHHRCWAIPAALRSTSRWKRARSFAALTALPLTLAGNRSIRGTKKALTDISSRLRASAIRAQPMCRPLMRSSRSLRCRPIADASPTLCWPREILAAP